MYVRRGLRYWLFLYARRGRGASPFMLYWRQPLRQPPAGLDQHLLLSGAGALAEGAYLWRDSLLWQLGRLLKRIVLRLYDNSHIVEQNPDSLPYHCRLQPVCMGILGTVGILFAGIVDIFVAVLLYMERKDLQKIVEGTQTIGSGDFGFKIDDSKADAWGKTGRWRKRSTASATGFRRLWPPV